MKNEKLLAKLNEALHTPYDFERIQTLNELISTIEDEIRMDMAKNAGQGKVMNLAKDILKYAAKMNRDALKFAYAAPDGYQYICDGYRILKLTKHLPLPLLPEGITPPDYSGILRTYEGSNPVELEAPDIAKLQAYVKIKKAEKVKPILYDFGEEFPAVNAEWLLTMMKAFPDVTLKAGKNNQAVLFVAKNGDTGLIMRHHKNDKSEKTEL